MIKYAYLDKGDILHIVAKEEDAKEYSKNGYYVPTDYPAAHGYPVDKRGDSMILYSEVHMRGQTDERTIPPALAELYKQCALGMGN